MNLERVCEALNIAKSTLSDMECGKSAVSIERWLQWCAVLRISPSDILKKWEMTEEFAEISKERRNGFHRLIDRMIKYGFGWQVEVLMTIFENVVREEGQRRRNEESKRKIRRYFPKVNV